MSRCSFACPPEGCDPCPFRESDPQPFTPATPVPLTRPPFPVTVASISPELRAWLDVRCECGHRRGEHYGSANEGPCLQHAESQAKTQRGKRLEGTVCPCSAFIEASSTSASDGARS